VKDNDAPQVRNRNYHRRYGHTLDRIEMLGVLRLAGRSVRCHWRLAAAELIHRSAPRTVCAAACRSGTGHRRRCTHAERKQQNDKNYGEKTHGHHLNLTVQNRQSGPYFSRVKGTRARRPRSNQTTIGAANWTLLQSPASMPVAVGCEALSGPQSDTLAQQNDFRACWTPRYLARRASTANATN